MLALRLQLTHGIGIFIFCMSPDVNYLERSASGPLLHAAMFPKTEKVPSKSHTFSISVRLSIVLVSSSLTGRRFAKTAFSLHSRFHLPAGDPSADG
jgi:hypothetical protein